MSENQQELRLKISNRLREVLEEIAQTGFASRTANDVAMNFIVEGVKRELGCENISQISDKIESFRKTEKAARRGASGSEVSNKEVESK